jgi:hypothetical protein
MSGKLNVSLKLLFFAAILIVSPIHASLIAPYILANAYVDATYSGSLDGNTQGSDVVDQYPASASVLGPGVGNVGQSAFAAVDQGYFRSSVDVQGESTILEPGDGHSFANTQLLDTLTVNGYTLILPMHIDGSVGITYAVANPFSAIPGQVSFAIGCNASTDSSSGMNTCQINGGFPSLYYSWNSSSNVNLTLDFVISTTPGVPFDFYWDTLLRADLELPPGTANIVGDFSHTGLFGPAEVLDKNGNVISDLQITSANGYNYLDPIGPSMVSTPEPRTTMMFCGGLLGVILRWRALKRR